MISSDSAGFRSGFVGIVGKPNVGKSTILNAILKRKISIVSPKPQTTRHRILGILTRKDAQLIFIDSPGWAKPQHLFGRHLITVAKGVIEDADVLVMVIDARAGLSREDEWVFQEVQRANRPAILVINKVDLVSKPLLLPLMEDCAKRGLFQAVVPMSAKTGENMPALLQAVSRLLPEGPRWYEADQITDQTTTQIIREFIREQVLLATHQEVPHAVAVMVDRIEEKETVTVIEATILVERDSHKAILIGKRGQMLKHIGTEARVELQRWLGRKIFLELWVKVAKDWREKPALLRQLGYEETGV